MEAQLYVENIRCGGCVNTIQREIAAINGVETVRVFKEEERIDLEVMHENVIADVTEKLKALGYPQHGTVSGFSKVTAGARSMVSCATGKFN